MFIGGIMYMVMLSGKQKIDLVTEDYYEQEIKYQERIDQAGRSAALSEKLLVALKGNSLEIRFPSEFAGKSISGKALLYYPADVKKDFTSDISTTDTRFRLEIPEHGSGLHILKLSWESGGITYYNEEQVFFP